MYRGHASTLALQDTTAVLTHDCVINDVFICRWFQPSTRAAPRPDPSKLRIHCLNSEQKTASLPVQSVPLQRRLRGHTACVKLSISKLNILHTVLVLDIEIKCSRGSAATERTHHFWSSKCFLMLTQRPCTLHYGQAKHSVDCVLRKKTAAATFMTMKAVVSARVSDQLQPSHKCMNINFVNFRVQCS
jgi:hypothetical protein